MKIAIITTADGSGAEVIPFLKTGAVLPCALFLTFLFTKLVSRFSREQVFYTILGGFLTYFALFLFVLFPNHESLRLDALADFLQTIFRSEGFSYPISCIRHFNLSLFYVLSEMWSAVVLSMLFWGFANEVTKVNEAKRFYAIFALGANCSGILLKPFTRYIKSIPYNESIPYAAEHQWVYYQLFSVLVLGLVIVGIFYWLSRTIVHLENASTLELPKRVTKLSLKDCFAYVLKSRYLAYIVVIVISYNLVYNLTDVVWTYKVKEVYPHGGDMNEYINDVAFYTGILAVILAFFVSGNVIRRFGWLIAALITPVIWLAFGLGFFSTMTFTGILSAFVSNPANIVLLIGSIQVVFGRGCKYTVFDETKEIAFVPLSKENKRKGKAIVDGLVSRFGKSGGSLIIIGLTLVCGNLVNSIPYIFAIMVFVILFWMYSVVQLGRMVNKTIDEESNEEFTEEPQQVDLALDGAKPATN